MTALLYFLIATFVAAAATRAWLLNRESGSHMAFLGMGWALCLAYACFSLSLLPGLRGMWIPSMIAFFVVPTFTVATFERLFQSSGPSRPMYRSKLALTTTLLIPVAFGIHLSWYDARSSLSPPLVAAGLMALATMAYAIWRLWQVHASVVQAVVACALHRRTGIATGHILLGTAATGGGGNLA